VACAREGAFRLPLGVFLSEVVHDGKNRKLCVFGFRLDVPASVVSCNREVSEANLKLTDPAALDAVILAQLSVYLCAVGECLVSDLDLPSTKQRMPSAS